ncbi:glycosyltransferase [Pelagovum pacificum]|uniref:Glycosyltransferase family 4 protein n=1 Tax=Pelagovum pacificum TaxID=2588711 RepID=A0A5C5GE69_9RHOB|nr:glycosyltransferase [Pelagovum pacificum]QQA44630.1 glycosyltransferase [Pelagovum pacificum]TNY32259.1 glycosyltransferase family 4 protein [Pelagovum pacificum]
MNATTTSAEALRIGIFVPWITLGRGGTENVGQMMANAMQARGHRVTVFTFDDKAGPSRWPLQEGIELVHLPEAAGVPGDRAMAVAVASRSLDLLVGLHMNRTLLRYAAVAQKVGIPLVLSEHIDPRFPEWHGSNSATERQAAFFGATLVHLLVDAFTATVTPFLQDRVRVIPNTIAEPEALAAPGREDAKTRTILTVARLVPRKNVAALVEAFARVAPDHADWTLKIVGTGPERRALQRLAKTLGVNGQVDFAGATDDPYPDYAAAEIFVLPSFFEGFPMSTLEAMAHGLPLIGMAICNGVNEQVVPGENGYLCGENGPDLSTALAALMADRGARSRMGQASRDRYLANYSNDVIFDRWDAMFREAVSLGPVSATAGPAEILSVRLAEATWGTDDLLLPAASGGGARV